MTYILITGLLLIFAIVYLKLAEKFSIVDNPNFRSSHSTPVIRGGGVLFYIAFLLFYVFHTDSSVYLFLGISLLSIVSFLDDLNPLSPKFRLVFQFLGAALVLVATGIFDLNPVFIVLLLIAAVGFINVYNFMDGINGITGIYSLVVLSSLYLLNGKEPFGVSQELIRYLLLAIAVFGYFNFRKKARFFAGDVGSISMAAIIVYIFFCAFMKFDSPLLLALLSVYGVDSVWTILRRLRLRENITHAHRKHAYQVLADKGGFGHLQISVIYGILQSLVSVVVLLFYHAQLEVQWVLLAGVLVLLSLLYFYVVAKWEVNIPKE